MGSWIIRIGGTTLVADSPSPTTALVDSIAAERERIDAAFRTGGGLSERDQRLTISVRAAPPAAGSAE